ncbi:GTP cyclohydrolase-like protein II [Truncatella angustata]|uniref:GTP cyclohydrolase-like protein II n=1 Tax=Truncatella angustata TaxID=152316 RepID=A0A9P9A1R9_9PEZI|nr:GTP cyclohydrolase-like protein II [Truncatella angustata]KAH6658384.1 GTP cyclohydrolase-like protein II [Truncatella angustata]
MASEDMSAVLQALKAIQDNQTVLSTGLAGVTKRLDQIAPESTPESKTPRGSVSNGAGLSSSPLPTPGSPPAEKPAAAKEAEKSGFTSRIILTTYPKQIGIDPLNLSWGASTPEERGPVVVSRSSSTIGRRNAIGAHGGSYSIYFALALASKQLDINHRPDFTNTEPAANIGPFPQWSDPKKIVAMDPWGHLAPWLFSETIESQNVDIRPTIAITKAHMKLPELEESVRAGRLVPDGKVCLNSAGELAVTKFAVEPVWYLPGVAARFGIDEGVLRRSLFEHTGGSYPELITRNDIKVFLPPIGGLTVYCFGDPAKMSDEKVRLALRIHDECNGSDVFGSDICTCRPYLIFGIEEAVKEAQNGGSGVVIYFRKEGRALGEVTKVSGSSHPIVYNARKRGEDRASDYFKRTENIAGVKDMRFQALMPDILHWLGIKKIDRMLSMSNMKHDAIVGQGIPIHERVELPEELIPDDSRVEIDAKITAGYFTTGHRMTEDELKAVQGRMWEE